MPRPPSVPRGVPEDSGRRRMPDVRLRRRRDPRVPRRGVPEGMLLGDRRGRVPAVPVRAPRVLPRPAPLPEGLHREGRRGRLLLLQLLAA